ncbi:MAG: alpha/beta fold hydrolase [Gammaproteobacteria bacterium]|nr:alpha/beta fold hydrolase [Gammaproteobacteria bacterium]
MSSSAPPLVLVPGLMCDAELWAHQCRHLSDIADCQVADTSREDSMEGFARAILAAAPPRFALAGLSMGGLIAHAVMAMAPERVLKLALVGTNARADTPAQTGRRRELVALAENGCFAEIMPLLMPALVHPGRLHDDLLVSEVATMAMRVGAAAFLRQTRAIIGRPDRRAALPGYRVPTLLICGREDVITPLDLHEEMADAIPGSELAIIEDCGHLSTLEQPQAVTTLLRRWLQYA